jgi:hypothetical protein
LGFEDDVYLHDPACQGKEGISSAIDRWDIEVKMVTETQEKRRASLLPTNAALFQQDSYSV